LQATCRVSSKIGSEARLHLSDLAMRKVKNITVAVPVDLYRQTRRLAAEYDTTVTAMVAYLLERLPIHVEKARFPKGEMKHRRVRGPDELAPSPSPDSSQNSL
jgi:hypothetical protein